MADGASEERGGDALIGTVLDKHYRVIRRIGVGGMSIVYLVEHMRLHKELAAKLLHAELAANPEAMSRFEIEAKAASRIEHENVVRVTDYGVAVDGRPYIIMELLRGRTLDEHLAETRLSLAESVLVIVSVCRGLASAHADGIVHRDVKPDNVFLTQRPTGGFGVKVLDFGIAKAPQATGKLTKHGQTIGSPHYMAPEACRGEEVDARADIYSVGVLMYLLFTGALPHHDDNFLKLLQRHVVDPITPPSQIAAEVTPELEAVIMHALARDPDDRYMSVEHLLSEFELALPPGANALLMTGGRVSTPIPTVRDSAPVLAPHLSPTGTRGAASPPTSPRPVAPLPAAPARSRRGALIALLALLVIGGAIAAWRLTRAGDDRTVAAASPPPGPSTAPLAAPPPPVDPAPPAPPADADVLPPRRVGSAAAVAPDPVPAVRTVHLSVTTKPEHAHVLLDGHELGTAPLQVDVAPEDAAALEIRQDGYAPKTRTLALVTDQTLEIELGKTPPIPAPAPAHPAPHPPAPPRPPRPHAGSAAAGSSAPPDLDIRSHR